MKSRDGKRDPAAWFGRKTDRFCPFNGCYCDTHCQAFTSNDGVQGCRMLDAMEDFRAAARTFVARKIDDVAKNEKIARIAAGHEEWRKRNPDYNPDRESLVDYWIRKYFSGRG